MNKQQDTTELTHTHSVTPHEESSSPIREELSGWGTNRRMSKLVSAKVVRYVTKKFEGLVESENFQNFQESSDADTQLCQVKHSQIQIGQLLGEGAFSAVFEIKRSSSKEIDDKKCVVKILRQTHLATPNLFAACALGIAREGAILSCLSHPHIIGVRACSQGGIASYASGRNDSFFLVLDRLEEMLSDRIEKWQKRACHLMCCLRHRKRKQEAFFLERLSAGAQLADAVAHLHKHNLLHRDLKPTNIGFDREGVLKVFDFDVSRVLPKTNDPNQTFRLTQRIGTRRFMSPECGLGAEYNLKADVYTFGLILYNILSTHSPFEGINDKDEHARKVFQQGLRPRPYASWPMSITMVLEQSWAKDICLRPTMQEIHAQLRLEVSNLGLEQATSKVSSKWSTRRMTPVARALLSQ
jgi:serine/threonine protein kinase